MSNADRLVPRTGGQILVDQLLIHGADCGFCVPGESYLAVLDALYDVQDRFRLFNARHEGGAANMAEAYGKMTGRPGIAMVTRGPGACQASIGVHIAFQDSTPMILLIGQVARDTTDREGFQEVDYRAMFGPIAKWVAQIEQADRIPEYLSRAFRVAMSGRPGPVVLSLPEDMLTDIRSVADAPPARPARAGMTQSDLDQAVAMLMQAVRPLLVVGGSGWDDAACAAITRFAEANGLPTTCSFRRQDIVDSRSNCFVGDLGTSTPATLRQKVKEADLILSVGARLGDMTTDAYSGLKPPRPEQKLIHIYPDANELGRVFAPDLAIAADPTSAAAALSAVDLGQQSDWAAWLGVLRGMYQSDTTPPRSDFDLDLGQAVAALNSRLPDDAVVTLDAGNHTGWPQRFLRYGRPGRQLGTTCGSMGYAVPAAVSAAICAPGRCVVGFVGDGGFMMTGNELATAVQYNAAPIIFVINNTTYGTIRMHQERSYPGRVVGTDLVNPDFCAMAASMGVFAQRVSHTDDMLPAFDRARACGRAALIELMSEPEQLSSRGTISALRARAG